MICDFAQYYHCFDWRALGVRLAGILLAGLPTDSRIGRRRAGLGEDFSVLLLGRLVDLLEAFFEVEKPIHVVQTLAERQKPERESACRSFESPEAFERFYQSITMGRECAPWLQQ